MVFAIALILLVVGSVLFHYLSPWYFTPIASNWGMIDDTVTITFWVTGFVFVTVNLFMAHAEAHHLPAAGHQHAAATAVHHEVGQQHPLGIYFKIWGLLFVLSAMSYAVDYFHVQGYLRWFLIITFMRARV